MEGGGGQGPSDHSAGLSSCFPVQLSHPWITSREHIRYYSALKWSTLPFLSASLSLDFVVVGRNYLSGWK